MFNFIHTSDQKTNKKFENLQDTLCRKFNSSQVYFYTISSKMHEIRDISLFMTKKCVYVCTS